jgi:hypothetical protein
MVPIWLAIAPALFFAAVGAATDRLCGLGLAGGWGQWPRWIACGVTIAFATCLHPTVLPLLAGLMFLARIGAGPPATVSSSPRSSALAPYVAAMAFALAAGAVLRPAMPMYWDAFVWLGKARIESGGLGHLRDATLDPNADVIPHGYPLLWPLAASWFSMFGEAPAALVAGAAGATLLAVLLFLDTAAEAFEGTLPAPAGFAPRPRWAFGGAFAVLLLTPMFWVHLRSAYADLPVGLLAATCMLRLGRCLDGSDDLRRDMTVAVLAATALAGTKDEGIGHVTVIVLAAVASQPKAGRREVLRWLAVLGSAATVFLAWRALLRLHHVVDTDHELAAPAIDALGGIGRVIASSAADTRTWGALWPIAIAAVSTVGVRGSSFRPATRFAALALVGQAALLALALVFGPDRVRTFAFEGTLVNRLLVQLAPGAAALLALALGDAGSRTSDARAISRSS